MESHTNSELDGILGVLENHVRREIIRRLSQEPAYPLQLSQELGVSQQLVTKHLDMMTVAGVVTSTKAASPTGPDRRQYALAKSVSVVVDFAPHLYNAQALSLETLPIGESSARISLMGRIDRTSGYSDEQSKITGFSKIIEEIDKRILRLQDERAVLLYVRNIAMREASEAFGKTEKRIDRKRVLHYILDQHNKDIDGISASLNLREANVRDIVTDLRKTIRV